MGVFFLRMTTVSGDRHFEENDRQKRKNESLHKSDKDLKAKEWQRGKVWHQKGNDDQKDFTRKNIAKKTKSEGNDFCTLSNKFEDTDKAPDRIPPWSDKKFARIGEESKGNNTKNLRGNNRDHGNRKRHIYICIHGTEYRDIDDVSFMESFNGDAAYPRQDPHPVGKRKEDENGGNEREEPPCLLRFLYNRIEEVEKSFNNHLDECLEPTGDFSVARTSKEKSHNDENTNGKPRHDHGVPQFESTKMRDRFGSQCWRCYGSHNIFVLNLEH